MFDIEAMLAFARSQLDEDERLARKRPYKQWTLTGPSGAAPTLCGSTDGRRHAHLAEPVRFYDSDGATLRHARHWDPARVLRLTTALRGLIDDLHWEARELYAVQALTEALYADRPGYHEDWRP